ncbi:MAG: serine/threonine-protein kinase [Planctomycetota bacterium]|jgi:hypothetical protein
MRLDDQVAVAVDEFFQRKDAGERPNPFEFEESLGEEFSTFLRAVEAKSILDSVIEPVMTTEPSRELGHYLLLRRLGRGGEGAVYEAQDQRTGEKVALKIIHSTLTSHASMVKRFEREGRLGAKIRHPNLVEVLESGWIDDQLFCAMQLIDGPTLKDRVKQGAMAPTAENVQKIVGICDGLVSLHEQGIVHRDVKPANIFVDGTGNFLLGDFGLARTAFESTVTQSGDALGTFGYMSPEQLRGSVDATDARTDVYSLGATLFEVFCGKPAHAASSISSLLLDGNALPPPDPRQVNPQLPPALAAIIMKAMERIPADRYESVQALRDDLSEMAAGRAVAGRPVHPVRRWMRRQRVLVACLGIVAVAAAIYGTYLATRLSDVAISSDPVAELFVSGDLQGHTPAKLELEPGSYTFRVVAENHVPQQLTVDLQRGPNMGLHFELAPTDMEDPEARKKLERILGHKIEAAELVSNRGSGDLPIGRALFPTGRCRLEDLAEFRFECSGDPMLEGPARFVVWQGSEVIHDEPLPLDELDIPISAPAELRAKLTTGMKISWGVVTAAGEVDRVPVEIAAIDGDELAQLDEKLAEAPAVMRHYFRAAALLKAGFPTAAYRATLEEPDAAASLAMRARALNALDALDSRMGDRLREAVAELPEAKQDAWFR